MAAPWISKYVPKRSREIIGQDPAVKQIREYLGSYKSQKKKAILIYGPPGTGKTSSVYAIGDELSCEIVELNASDFRNKDAINSIVGSASRQRSLFAKSKIILVDEIDGLSGTKDRGGIAAVAALLKDSAFPMVLTALDPFDSKLSGIRSNSVMVEFSPLAYTAIYEKLSRICAEENISYEEIVLKSLARRSGGDMRAAINDLQSLAAGNKRLEKADLELLSDREQLESIQDALLKIFKSSDPKVALSSLDYVNLDYDRVMLWLSENLPKEYTSPEDLEKAYDRLSRADVFRGRIRRWQHWRFLVYVNTLITAGVALAKTERKKEPVAYTDTKRILKMWMANQRYQKRLSIAGKIAERTHSSKKAVVKDVFPYMSKILAKKGPMAEAMIAELDLDKDEVAWLRK